MPSRRRIGVTSAYTALFIAAGLALYWATTADVANQKTTAELRAAAVLGVPPEPTTFPFHLIALMAAASALMAAFWWRHKRHDAVRETLRSRGWHDPDEHDASAQEKLPHFYERPFQEVPRALLENPYGPEFEALDFSERVQIAIEGSLRLGRVIAVVHFHIPPAGLISKNGHSVTAVEVAAVLKANTRSSDGIHISDAQNVFVFLSLISRKEKLEGIGKRLADAVFATAFPATTPTRIPGCAMYPIDGYDAEALMAAAKARSTSWPDQN